MSQSRPRLLIIGGNALPADELAHHLRDRYDVAIAPSGALPAKTSDSHPSLIVCSAEELDRLREAAAEAGTAALLDAVGHGACLVGADGAVAWSNQRFQALDDRVRGQIAAACREMSRRTGGRGAEAPRRFEVASPDGSRFYEAFVSTVPGGKPGADGQSGHKAGAEPMAVLVRDITSERRIRQKMDAIDQAGSELVRFDADAVRRMNVFERLGLLERKIVNYCRELLNFDHFAIRLIDEKTGKLALVMASGLPQEAIELDLYPSREGNGISGHVAASGRSYICYDTEKDERYLPGLTNARSSLTVPLRLHDKVIGIFNIESEKVGAFSEDDRQFAEIFARYVAMALNMLDLLVVERSTTNETACGRVEGELIEPLEDLERVAEWLKQIAASSPETGAHIQRIRADVESIRRRVRNVASGPQTLLGVERELAERRREPVFESKRILVADDEPNVRRIIHDVLHNRGSEVVTCEDGQRAIERLEAAARGEVAGFDVVVSDIKMPDRNGYEVFAAARQALPGVPVILMTGFGYDPHHSIVRASQEGLQSVLFKPFQVERLLDEVRKALLARTQAPQA